jgi:hypothetical protein
MTDERDITSIILVGHNFKAYTLKYWNGSAYVDLPTVVSVTGNTDGTTFHEFAKTSTSRIELIITETMVVDADKKMLQTIITENLVTGQLDGWPIISKPRHSTKKKVTEMLSGKVNVVESVGGFSMDIKVSNWNIDADLDIIEEIYLGKRGVLVWVSGGDEAQFSHLRLGYRKKDIYLMRAVNDYSPEWTKGIYVNGLKINMKLREAIG